jgi:hypothetical protein
MGTRLGEGDFRPYDYGRSAGRFSIQNVVGGGAVAIIALACAGTLVAHLFAGGVSPVLASANVGPRVGSNDASFDERFVQPTFADRFGPVLATAPAKKPNQYVALLDPTYSLGYEPDSFKLSLPESDRVTTASLPAARAPAPAQVASVVRMPTPRPAAAKNEGPTLREIAQASKAMAVANANAPQPTIFDKLFGTSKPAVLAYAAPDGGIGSDGRDSTKSGLYDRTTAVYDISAHTVYLPDGTKLEAHSGLGSRLDDPRYAHERMRGVTPPHIYDLTPREALFHGVPALRLNPIGGEGAIHGRSGLLAHTYMLGPNGDSNGCVSFKDYNKFLQAFRNGDVKRLVVVAKID